MGGRQTAAHPPALLVGAASCWGMAACFCVVSTTPHGRDPFAQDGCPTAKLDFQQCQLLALPACTLQPTIQQTGWPVVTTTGNVAEGGRGSASSGGHSIRCV